jgi:hypothetical protein
MIVGANQFRLAAGKRVVSGFQTGVILAGISFLTSKTAPLYAHLAPSRHCKTIFVGSTPTVRHPHQQLPELPDLAACFCNTSPARAGGTADVSTRRKGTRHDGWICRVNYDGCWIDLRDERMLEAFRAGRLQLLKELGAKGGVEPPWVSRQILSSTRTKNQHFSDVQCLEPFPSLTLTVTHLLGLVRSSQPPICRGSGKSEAGVPRCGSARTLRFNLEQRSTSV